MITRHTKFNFDSVEEDKNLIRVINKALEEICKDIVSKSYSPGYNVIRGEIPSISVQEHVSKYYKSSSTGYQLIKPRMIAMIDRAIANKFLPGSGIESVNLMISIGVGYDPDDTEIKFKYELTLIHNTETKYSEDTKIQYGA